VPFSLLASTTSESAPLDASATKSGSERKVSSFLTIQSLTNFAATTGAIAAAWGALQTVVPGAAALWVPYVFALAWGAISLAMSLEALKKDGKVQSGVIGGAIFVALINSLVLAGAVVGTRAVSTPVAAETQSRR
jgi:hypothetical protein